MLRIMEQITFLYTRDMDASVQFYEEILGLELALNQGGCRIYHMVGRKAYVGVCLREVPRTPDGVIFTIVTPDVDAWYEHITGHGINCDNAPRVTSEYGIYHFFVRDPNGYLIEFQRFLADSWDQSLFS